jgi:hypothetical protein
VVSRFADAGGKGVRFDLTPLAPTESAMKQRLESAAAAADSFASRWPIEMIRAIDSAELTELLGELADLRAAREEGRWWAFLLARTDSENPNVLDVQAWVDDRLPRFDAAIRQFELGWVGVAEKPAAQLVLV